MPTPHKHAALIKQWADDTSRPVWLWTGHEWVPPLNADCPLWLEHVPHAVGPKPTQPPRKMCCLAGVEFPAPETVRPEKLTQFHTASLTRDWSKLTPALTWSGASFGEDLVFSLGLVHLTREAAEQHSRALLAANKQAIEGSR